MKKVFCLILIMFSSSLAFAHLPIRDASTLTRGTLPNARLDPSSVTLLGGNLQLGSSQYADGSVTSNDLAPNAIRVSSQIADAIINSNKLTSDAIRVSSQIADAIINSNKLTSNIVMGTNVVIQQIDAGVHIASWSSLTISSLTVKDSTGGIRIEGITRLSSVTVSGSITSTSPAYLNGIYIKNTMGVNDGTTIGAVRALTFSGAGNGGITISGDTATLTMNDTTGGGAGISTMTKLQGLFISTVGTTANQIYVSIDRVDVMGSSFPLVQIATICDMSKGGPGGLIDGTDIANQIYTVFLISDGSTVSVVMSKGSVYEPTSLPTGYNRWKLIGRVLNDAGSAIRPFYQRGNVITYDQIINLVQSGTPSLTFVKLLSSNYISSSAISCYIDIHFEDGGATNVKGAVQPFEWTADDVYTFAWHILATGATDAQFSSGFVEIPMYNSRDIKYRVVSGGTPTWVNIDIIGYKDGAIQ